MSASTEARGRYNVQAIADMDDCVEPLEAPCVDCGGVAYVVADNRPLCHFDAMIRDEQAAEVAGIEQVGDLI